MNNDTLPRKPCKDCGRDLPISMFHRQRGGRLGTRTRCKECCSRAHVSRAKTKTCGCGNRYEGTYLSCRDCWPKCSSCHSTLPTKGAKTTIKRCPECQFRCSKCDVNPTIPPKRLCEPCSGTCGLCGGPGAGPGRRCSPCALERRRAIERRAKEALGGRCSRCGIGHPTQWDHINDDAPNKPGRKRSGVAATEKAEINQIADTGQSDRLQLLCPNCNFLKEYDRLTYDQPPLYGPI